MRFLSSSAFVKADQLILAASCSAAEAIRPSGRRPHEIYASACLLKRRFRREAVAPRRKRSNTWAPGAPFARGASRAIPARLPSSGGRGLRGLAQDLERAARLLDGRGRALRRGGDLEMGLGLEFARAEQLHAIARMREHA